MALHAIRRACACTVLAISGARSGAHALRSALRRPLGTPRRSGPRRRPLDPAPPWALFRRLVGFALGVGRLPARLEVAQPFELARAAAIERAIALGEGSDGAADARARALPGGGGR